MDLWLEHGDLVFEKDGFTNRQVNLLTNSKEFPENDQKVMVGRPSPNNDIPLRWVKVSLTGFGRNQPRFNSYPTPHQEMGKYYQTNGVRFTIGKRAAYVMPNGVMQLGKQLPDYSWSWERYIPAPNDFEWYAKLGQFGVHIVDFKYLPDGRHVKTISVDITEIPAQHTGAISHYQEWVFKNMK